MKKVKNCTKLVPFFARDDRLRPKWTLFTLFGHHFKNTHSNHCLPLSTYILKFKFGYSFMGWVANALKSWKVGRGQKKVENP